MEIKMKSNRLYHWAAVFIIAALLASCGFHLRGNYDFTFSTLYIDFPQNSHTARLLKRLIRGMDLTKIVNNPKEAEVILSAISESTQKEVLSYNSQGRAREYSLYYNLEFTARTAQGKILIEPTKISLRRTMTYDDSQALSKENEEIMLYKDMQSDMAQQILRRLAFIKLTEEDKHAASAPAAETEPAIPSTP